MTTKALEHYKANAPQDIDGAIVRALAAAAEQQAIIDFLMQCPRSSSIKRSENYHAALFKLIKSNMLPHDAYDTILSIPQGCKAHQSRATSPSKGTRHVITTEERHCHWGLCADKCTQKDV
jgi:hypothetical protein